MSSPQRAKSETCLLAGMAPDSPIQACPHCEALIEISELEPLSRIQCPKCHAELTIRGWIDHFRLTGIAGKGGMGVVYRAMDPSLDRPVALKLLLKEQSTNEKLIAQLEKEAAVTAAINHPNVIKVFTTGIDHGRFFIVMELADKGSLLTLINAHGRLPETEVLDIAIQIADGLRAAHQFGLIHRDIKPGNILFSDRHIAKIVDFGLALFISEMTGRRREVWGTPYYVAPEKLDYKPEDFRSDIYSLGATLYHALAGRPPFDAETPNLIAIKHVKSQAVSLQAFAPWVSGPTAYVINRTLHKDPDERYQSYKELIEHLQYAKAELMKRTAKPEVAPQRLVLENEHTQRAMLWISVATIAVILIGVAALLFRHKLFSPRETAHVATASHQVSRDESLFFSAVDSLASGNTGRAADRFHQVADANRIQPQWNWAMLGEGLSHLIAGNEGQADAAFRKVAERSLFSAQPTEAALGTFFFDTARRMTDASPIDPSKIKDIHRDSYESIALLMFGVKNWNLGEIPSAVQFLREFRNATPGEPYRWIVGLSPVASQYLDQFGKFEQVADKYRNTPPSKEKAILGESLKRFSGGLGIYGNRLTESLVTELANALSGGQRTPRDSPVPTPKPAKPVALLSSTPLGMTQSVGPWRSRDIGKPKIPGQFHWNNKNGRFTVTAEGKDVWFQTDNFYFVYQRVSGDFELIGRVVSMTAPQMYSKAGIMIRLGLGMDGANKFIHMTKDKGIAQQFRLQSRAETTSVRNMAVNLPTRLKLIRRGNTISGFYSGDGNHWTELSTDTFPDLPVELFAGLAVTSHQENEVCTAVFEEVEIRSLASGTNP